MKIFSEAIQTRPWVPSVVPCRVPTSTMSCSCRRSQQAFHISICRLSTPRGGSSSSSDNRTTEQPTNRGVNKFYHFTVCPYPTRGEEGNPIVNLWAAAVSRAVTATSARCLRRSASSSLLRPQGGSSTAAATRSPTILLLLLLIHTEVRAHARPSTSETYY